MTLVPDIPGEDIPVVYEVEWLEGSQYEIDYVQVGDPALDVVWEDAADGVSTFVREYCENEEPPGELHKLFGAG